MQTFSRRSFNAALLSWPLWCGAGDSFAQSDAPITSWGELNAYLKQTDAPPDPKPQLLRDVQRLAIGDWLVSARSGVEMLSVSTGKTSHLPARFYLNRSAPMGGFAIPGGAEVLQQRYSNGWKSLPPEVELALHNTPDHKAIELHLSIRLPAILSGGAVYRLGEELEHASGVLSFAVDGELLARAQDQDIRGGVGSGSVYVGTLANYGQNLRNDEPENAKATRAFDRLKSGKTLQIAY